MRHLSVLFMNSVALGTDAMGDISRAHLERSIPTSKRVSRDSNFAWKLLSFGDVVGACGFRKEEDMFFVAEIVVLHMLETTEKHCKLTR